MSVSTNRSDKPRIPVEVEGIQVNFFKNPKFSNICAPASAEKQPRGPWAGSRGRDKYKVTGGGYSDGRPVTPAITCLSCKETPPLKRYRGIYEEKQRVSEYLAIIALLVLTRLARTIGSE